jgi:hypothetical protein
MLLVTHVLKPKFIFAARAIIILANLAVAAVVKIQKVYPGNFNDFNWTLLGVKMCKVPCRNKIPGPIPKNPEFAICSKHSPGGSLHQARRSCSLGFSFKTMHRRFKKPRASQSPKVS